MDNTAKLRYRVHLVIDENIDVDITYQDTLASFIDKVKASARAKDVLF